MMKSRNFDARWLEDRVASFPEGVFLDFKIQPPILDEGLENKFNFAKHLIAFGNMARSTGRECHIIFGVDDKTRQIRDLRNFYHPAELKRWNEATSIHAKQVDGVETRIRQIADTWIRPEIPRFSLEYGETQSGTFLSYLVIYPTDTTVPFALSKPHGDFSASTVFVRVCSSSVRLAPSEIKNLLPSSEIEYLSRSEWQKFFQVHSSGEFLKAHDLLPTFKHKTKDGRDGLESVIAAIQGGTQKILIKGGAGTGKSTLLRRIAYQLSHSVLLADEISRNDIGEGERDLNEDEYIVSSFKDDLSNLPRSRVPVYMSLRTTFRGIEELNRHLLIEIQNIINKGRNLEGFLKNSNVSWVILLDGVDEIRNREVAGPILGEWLRFLPENVQVVLASRPYASPDIASEVIELSNLRFEETLTLIDGKMQAIISLQNEDAAEKLKSHAKSIMKFVEAHPDFLEFVNRHRAIDGLLEYFGIPAEQTSINDIPRTLIEPQATELLADNTGEIPVIGNNIQLESDDYFSSELETKPLEESDKPIRLVELFLVVYEYLRAVEIVRQREWGWESKKEADQAAYRISQAAWLGTWKENELNIEKSVMDESSLDWNIFAGFISPKKMPRFQYCCELFQQFLIAEYGYENKSEEMITTFQIDGGLMDKSVSKIKELYDEFCEWRGQKPFAVE